MKSLTRVFVAFLLAITIAFGGFSGNAHAQSTAGTLDDLTKVYESAKQGGKEYFCRKGDFGAGTYSVRSFNGTLCSNFKSVAALSQYTCKNPEVAGFIGSQCDTKGLKYLNGADPVVVIKQELASTLPFPIGNLIGLFFKG